MEHGLHVKAKLHEANKCFFVIRSLRKDGYTQDEIDHLFNSIVIPKLLYGLSVYAASVSELTVIQRFLKDAIRGIIRRSITIYMIFWRKATDAFFISSNAMTIH